ncbi:MAG: hypothetical protein A2V86_01810 [Deltaproteobacteria bacterium RBG_16_49_23]|nr:MAG: hypothetical protein A2V86_01810 [Deltaproteobacteria bacterium RBG_16_49_23]
MKKSLPLIILSALIILSCARPAPPPTPPKEKLKTEFLLVGHRSPSGQPDRSQETLEKKKEIYHALKDLSGQNHIVIIYDASGSMKEKLEGKDQKRFEAAYEGLKQIVTLFKPNDRVGLIVFGSKKLAGLTSDGVIIRKDYTRAMEACGDVEIIFNPRKKGFDQKEFLAAIHFLGSEKAYIGDTPIGYSVLKAHSLLKGLSNAMTILITDGEETGPLLAQNVAKNKAWEQRLRREYPDFDELTLSAFDAIKRLVDEKIHFSPILYGLRGSGDKEAQKIRDFYHKLATASGSVYLEAVTPQGLLNAFMEAEMMSFTFALYSTDPGKKGPLAARGKVGIPLMIEEGKYLLRTDTEKPFEQEVELKPRVKNIFSFNINREGKMSLVAIGNP